MFTQHDSGKLKKLGLSEESVTKANSNNHFDDGYSHYDVWSEYSPFYKTKLDLHPTSIPVSNTVSTSLLGTGQIIEIKEFDTGQEALDYYIDTVDNKSFYFSKGLFFKIPLFYISDLIFKIFVLPFLFIFNYKEFIKEFKGITLKKIVSVYFKKTFIDFGIFNEYFFVFLAIPFAFALGAFIF